MNIGQLPKIECDLPERLDVLVDEDLSMQFKVRSILPPEIWIEKNGTMLSPELVINLSKLKRSKI